MGIFSRFADIVNSNLNAILDRAEEPEKIVRLMVQEMEETLIEVRATAARTIAERKELERKLARLQAAQGDWQGKAELALAKGREDLARAALAEKAKVGAAVRALQDELAQLDATLARLGDDIAKLEAKLREVKAKQKAIELRQQATSSQLEVRRRLHDNRIEEALTRFEKMEARIDATQAEIEAYDLGRGRSLGEELGALAGNAAIDEEIERMKARLAADRKPAGGA